MKIKSILSNNQMIYSITELKKIGLSQYKINNLVNDGSIKKLNKHYYENTNYNGDNSDFYYAYAYASKGVICLLSAANYYNLTTFIPDSIDVAIPRKTRISTLPDWPTINIYYYTNKRFDLGINTIYNDENIFKIYNIEKTVIDIIYYRNKVGLEETKEILTNYLRRKDRNINQLVEYSKKMKCYDILKNYLEVLI
ncbi:MAG: hypothetical protein LBM02_04230 [Lachnospiraceae bacterium]|jgi:predicted transcriptional regulator of viral defense system|nr:hypothetical protein [Lachnospiraceae bacterium]